MNTNQLKKFAQATRKKLLEQISAKLEYVLGNETAELRERARVVAQLKEEVKRHGKQQIIDKIAYTWFNRFVALRFMDVNEYQPLGINIVTALLGQVSPQILQDAMAGNISGELNVDKQKVFGLLDGKIKSANAENDAYRLLLIAACNHLHRIFPFLFEQIDDYTELLLPDDLTSQFSLLHDVVEGLTEDDGKQVECIGWLYQFYISERKDEVFASKEKVKKEDIPAATQLFTPRWIVEYMVQNTVGKLWLMNHPGSSLRQHMPYYIESEATKIQDYLKINSPEELTLLDQACGSGHILVYGFELLYRIYEEQGYSTSEIPALIIRHNLHGMEIDERAAQLSSLAILMKAREYQPRLFKKTEVPVPNITCYEDLPYSPNDIKDALTAAGIKASDELKHDLDLMRQATNLGSLIIPLSSIPELDRIQQQVRKALPAAGLLTRPVLEDITTAIDTLQLLSTKYCCVVDNPPYMGGGNANKELADYVKLQYPDSKADLMTCFMEAGLHALLDNGMLGMINQHSWMFLGSYEELRNKLIDNYQFDTLLHLGPRTFPEIGGEVVQNAAFTFVNRPNKTIATFFRLTNFGTSELKRSNLIDSLTQAESVIIYKINQEEFKKIPGRLVGYFMPDKLIQHFKSPQLKAYCDARIGLVTGDTPRFLRLWWEISISDSNLSSGHKWFKYQKGGEFRKWYGNNYFVLNWENDGWSCKNDNSTTDGRVKSHNYNGNFAFKSGIVWTKITGGIPAFREVTSGYMFDDAGPLCWVKSEENIGGILAFLNSKVCKTLLETLSPTLNLLPGHLNPLPIPFNPSSIGRDHMCTDISKQEWDSRETSWDFKQNEPTRIKGQDLEEAYDLYQQYWSNKFYQLHKNEEELNRQFIDIYGLQDELAPDVPLEDITILKQESSIEDGELVFYAAEVFAQFVSYSVGCMVGRYSPDVEGLILASQGETMKDYFEKTGSDKSSASFLPDDDNIIPVLDDEWFDDDIVASFYKFLKVTFGEKNFRKNLDFIEEQLGKDIRKYFVKDFYTDHIQRYKKRPIYWMFSSPKGHFNVLVYLHRYTPDTLNNILNNYLREFIEKLKTRTEHLKEVEVKGSAAEKTKAGKEIERIKTMLTDCQDYERNILYPLAAERIAIDLDNGVLVNYNCFGKAVKEVKGLNDTKTKNDVRKFDWIDTAMIQ